ncbi:hypothetical protein C8F04DRAFT_1313404 [Mycena alexandri]|uniref:Uncharacterized protein n=1 Tax=Mycena alexandri TaxID=1745969 RepID=A0AAD6WP17_9AGAR|nr:hypothetical protein C8F04DRAFT_1313404 [Mycena alexandri]
MWGTGWRRHWPLAACERAPSAFGPRRCDALIRSSGRPRAGPLVSQRHPRETGNIKAVVQRGEGGKGAARGGFNLVALAVWLAVCASLSKRGREDGAGAGAKEEAEDEEGEDENGEFVEVDELGKEEKAWRENSSAFSATRSVPLGLHHDTLNRQTPLDEL